MASTTYLRQVGLLVANRILDGRACELQLRDGLRRQSLDVRNGSWLRNRIGHAYRHAIDRALKRGIPFDVSIDRLVEIFPKDYRCPILGTLREWKKQGGKRTSPSIDRISLSASGNRVFAGSEEME